MKSRAVAEVIAAIILIIVAVAVAMAAVGRLMGVWTGSMAKPQLSITDATLYVTIVHTPSGDIPAGLLVMLVADYGQGDADIYEIRVDGKSCTIGSNDILRF